MRDLKRVMACVLCLVLVFAVAGCKGVSKDEHDALQAKYDMAEKQIAAAQKAAVDMKAQIQSLTEAKATLTAEVKKFQDEIAKLKSTIAELQKGASAAMDVMKQ
jgi:septal ring factor EnvC (AmiA/AmiB activator)